MLTPCKILLLWCCSIAKSKVMTQIWPLYYGLLSASFFRRLISDIAWPIVAKLCHAFEGDPDLKFGQKFGWPLPPEIWRRKNTKLRRNFAQLRVLIANISGTQQDIVNRKRRCRLYGHPSTVKLNSVYFDQLVHKRRKTGPEFWPTQRAAIRLGLATHLVTYCTGIIILINTWSHCFVPSLLGLSSVFLST